MAHLSPRKKKGKRVCFLPTRPTSCSLNSIFHWPFPWLELCVRVAALFTITHSKLCILHSTTAYCSVYCTIAAFIPSGERVECSVEWVIVERAAMLHYTYTGHELGEGPMKNTIQGARSGPCWEKTDSFSFLFPRTQVRHVTPKLLQGTIEQKYGGP